MKTKSKEQLRLQTAKVLIRVLSKTHPNTELVARANRWLDRN